MATSGAIAKCYACGKNKTVFICKGCSKDFCLEDLNKHSQLIGEQFDMFQNECDRFRQKLIDQKDDPTENSLIQQVNQWEQDSIKKIKTAAKECREILMKHAKTNINDMEKRLNQLSNQIRQIHHEGQFNEVDLDRLKKQLKTLADELNRPSNITIQEDSTTFIRNISLHTSSTNVNESNINSRSTSVAQEFLDPSQHRSEYCDGRLCANCRKCRDWYFTGDANTLSWIRNFKNWSDQDWNRWNNDDYWKLFKRRNGATCDFLRSSSFSFFSSSRFFSTRFFRSSSFSFFSSSRFFSSFLRSHCFCEDNISK